MSYVELDIVEYKRILSILSQYFESMGMDDLDLKLRNKLEIMLEAEIKWEDKYHN